MERARIREGRRPGVLDGASAADRRHAEHQPEREVRVPHRLRRLHRLPHPRRRSHRRTEGPRHRSGQARGAPGPHGHALRAGPRLRGELPAQSPAALRGGVQLLHLPRARPRRVPPRRARGQVRRVHPGGAWAEPAPA